MGKLFAVIVVVVTVISSAIFISRIWWLPADISVLGVGIDRQMTETMIAAGVLFVTSQLVLALFVWQYGDKGDRRPIKTFPGGAVPMVVLATLLVGAEIVVLTLVGTKVWGGIFLSAARSQGPADRRPGGTVRLLFPLSRTGRQVRRAAPGAD